MHRPPTALIAVVIAGLAVGTAAPQDADKAAPTVKHVMTTMTVPASDEIFNAAAEPPKDAAQWVAVRASAARLAESGRLLTTAARAKDDEEWTRMARALVTEAEATFKAIDARDADALGEAADSLFLACKACHDKHVPQ